MVTSFGKIDKSGQEIGDDACPSAWGYHGIIRFPAWHGKNHSKARSPGLHRCNNGLMSLNRWKHQDVVNKCWSAEDLAWRDSPKCDDLLSTTIITDSYNMDDGSLCLTTTSYNVGLSAEGHWTSHVEWEGYTRRRKGTNLVRADRPWIYHLNVSNHRLILNVRLTEPIHIKCSTPAVISPSRPMVILSSAWFLTMWKRARDWKAQGDEKAETKHMRLLSRSEIGFAKSK